MSYASGLSSHVIPTPEPPLRTLSDVRAQVASEMAVRAIGKAEMLDGNTFFGSDVKTTQYFQMFALTCLLRPARRTISLF